MDAGDARVIQPKLETNFDVELQSLQLIRDIDFKTGVLSKTWYSKVPGIGRVGGVGNTCSGGSWQFGLVGIATGKP